MAALNVETEVLMPARDLAYSVESFAPTARGTNEKHGIFWVPMRTAKLFFAVYNSSDETITVRPELSFDGTVSQLDEIVLAPKAFGNVKMRAPQAWRLGVEPVGSITIRHDGPAGAVQSTGWIDCAREGYSAMMAFTDPGLIFGNELYGTQIFIGRHPSLRSLGQAGDVESHLVLKNMSSVALTAEAEIFYAERGRVGVSPVALGTIHPGEVVSLSFDQLQNDGLLPKSISDASVLIRHRGQEGAVMGRVFGISSDKKFGFYTKLENFVAGGYDAVRWTTEGDRDSVITITNFGEESDDVTVTLAYNGGSVDLPGFVLEPHVSRTINIRDYSESLPAGIAAGGYAVHGRSRRTSRLLTKQHVFSASEQMALPFYGTYVYAVALYMANTNAVTLGSGGDTTDVTLWMQYSDYNQDLCWWCDDSTSNANVATIGGLGSTRTISGVSAGSATVSSDSWEIIDEMGQMDYIYSLPPKPVSVVTVNWADHFNLDTDWYGNVLLTQAEYNQYTGQGFAQAGVIFVPGLGQIVGVGVGITIIAIYGPDLVKAAAEFIKDTLNPLATGPCTLVSQTTINPPAGPGGIGSGPVMCTYSCQGYGALVPMFCSAGATCRSYVADGWLQPARDCL